MGGWEGVWEYSLVVGCLPGMWVAKSQHYKKQLIKQYRITVSTLENCGKRDNVKVFYATEICPSLFSMVGRPENFRSSTELPQSYHLLKRAPLLKQKCNCGQDLRDTVSSECIASEYDTDSCWASFEQGTSTGERNSEQCVTYPFSIAQVGSTNNMQYT